MSWKKRWGVVMAWVDLGRTVHHHCHFFLLLHHLAVAPLHSASRRSGGYVHVGIALALATGLWHLQRSAGGTQTYIGGALVTRMRQVEASVEV